MKLTTVIERIQNKCSSEFKLYGSDVILTRDILTGMPLFHRKYYEKYNTLYLDNWYECKRPISKLAFQIKEIFPEWAEWIMVHDGKFYVCEYFPADSELPSIGKCEVYELTAQFGNIDLIEVFEIEESEGPINIEELIVRVGTIKL